MAAGDVYSITVDQTIQSQAVSNTQHFKQVGSDGTGDARDAINDIWGVEFRPELKACMSQEITIVQQRIRMIHPTQTQAKIFALGEDGDTAETSMPSNSCAIIRLIHAGGARKGTGFSKICGVPITAVDLGRVNVAYADLLQTYADKFSTSYTHVASGFVFEPAVWSRIDDVGRTINLGQALTRLKTVHSRQIGVGA